jgi:hypothetical protein
VPYFDDLSERSAAKMNGIHLTKELKQKDAVLRHARRHALIP